MKRPGVQCAVIAVIAAVAAMSSAKAAGDVALAAVCSKPVKPTPGLRLAAAGVFEEERP